MTTVITGQQLGLFNSSLALLGGGVGGNPALNRFGDNAYINAATGNLTLQDQDLFLAGFSSLGLVRTYNSQGLWNDGHGVGLSVNRRLFGQTGTVNTAGSTITREVGDGTESVFSFDATRGLYVSQDGDGASNTLSFNTATLQWLYTAGSSRATDTYNSSGTLVSAADNSGHTTLYTYNAAGQLSQVTDAAGQSVYLDYSGNNLVDLRTLSNGVTETRVRYAYDAANRLTQVTLDLSPADNSIADGKVYTTSFTYDGASNRIASITDGSGGTVSFGYTQVGPGFRLTALTDATGAVTSLSYDTVNRQTDVTDALGHVTSYQYDAKDRLVAVLQPVLNGVRATTHYTYDATDNITAITDALGNVTNFSYDANGNVLSQQDSLGDSVSYTYDAANQRVTETRYLVPDPDGSGPATPGSPLTTRFAYDSNERLRFTVSAQGRVTEYRYNAQGLLGSTVQYPGALYPVSALTTTATLSEATLSTWAAQQDPTTLSRTDTNYDFRGQVASVTTYAKVDANGNGVADGSQAQTLFVYDQAGLLLQTVAARGVASVDPSDYVTNYTYDGLGRPLTQTQWLNAAQTRTTVTQYDDPNHKITTTAANGLITTAVYDNVGDLLSASQSGAGGVALGTTTFTYDADHRLRMTQDPLGVRKYLLYDAAGHPVAAIDASSALTETVYDLAGQAIETLQYANLLTSTQLASLLDANGQPTNPTLASLRPALSSDDRITAAVYDNAHRLIFTVTADGAVTEEGYDGAGQVIKTIQYATAITLANLPANPSVSTVRGLLAGSADDRSSRNFYDADGKLLASLDGEGYLIENSYDAAGRLVQTTRYATATPPTARAAGTLADLRPAASGNDQITRIFYNSRNQVIGQLDAEGYLTETVYDLAGNVTQTMRYATPTLAANRAAGTLNTLRPASTAQDQVTTATYTALNQLASKTNPEGTIVQYTYDVVGNLIQTVKAVNTSDSRTLQARYDSQGRLTGELTGQGSQALATLLASPSYTQAQVDAIWASYGLTHTYDQDGHRIATTDQNGNKTVFYYDSQGRLTHSINALGEVTEQDYNAFGELAASHRYANRLSPSQLASLTGGLVSSSLTTLLTGLADSTRDRLTQTRYTNRGQIQQAIDAAGHATTATYNAFGDKVSQLTPQSAIVSLLHRFTYDHRGLLLATLWDPNGFNTQSTNQYDAFGRIIQTQDANGNVSKTNYDRLGRVITTVDALNNARSQTYDAFNRVLTQTDALGNSITYTYNDANRSLSVTDSLGITTTTVHDREGEQVRITDGRGNTTTYAYDLDGNLITVLDATGKVQSQTFDHADRLLTAVDRNGITTAYSYDAVNRQLSRTLDPTGLNQTTQTLYDAFGQTIITIDPNGVVTQTVYGQGGHAVSIVRDPVTAQNPNGLNLRTDYTYDAQGRTLTVTEGAGSSIAKTTAYVYDILGRRIKQIQDPNGLNLATNYVYDNDNNVIAKTDAAGNSTRYVYDAGNELLYTIDALGGVTQNTYDADGRVVQTQAFANAINLTSLPGLATPLTASTVQAALIADGARDRIRRIAFDQDGRQIFTMNSLGNGQGIVQEKTYDADGNVVKTTAYATTVPLTTPTTVSAIRSALTPSAQDEITRSVYDVLNRLVYTLDGQNHVRESRYDNNGNVIQTIAYANAVTLSANPPAVGDVQTAAAAVANSAQDRIARTVYDSANRPVYQIDALGFVKETRYGKAGHIVAEIAYANPLNLSALPTPLTPSAVANALSTLLDAAHDQVTRHTYDGAGRLLSTTDALGNSESYTYDVLGNKKSFTNKKGDTWTYEYDSLGRLKLEHTPVVAVTRLSQDSSGNVTPITTQEAITSFIQYDALGNVKSRTEGYGTADARTTTYVYDALGRQVATQFPQANVYSAGTDQQASFLGRHEQSVAPQSATFYDALGNALASRDVAGNYTYKVYDALGRVVYDIDAERYVSLHTYDAFGNELSLTRYATKLNETAFTAKEAQTPNPGFKLSEMAALIVASGQDRTLTTTYDVLNRVTQVLQPQVYTYDPTAPAGNQYALASPATKNTYNGFGQLVQQAALLNSNTNTWATTTDYYDQNGHKLAEVNAQGYLTAYQYDAEGNLKQQTEYAQALAAGSWTTLSYGTPTVTSPQSAPTSTIGYDRTTKFAYDALNRKTAETKVGVQYTAAAYAGTATLTQVTGDLTTTTAYDALGNVTRVTDPTGATSYMYYDVLGRTIATADPTRLSDKGGSTAMPVLSVTGLGSGNPGIVFDKTAAGGAGVGFQYAAVGTSNWTTATLQDINGRYFVSLANASSDLYQYKLTYTRAGETSPYATGAGTIAITGLSSANSVNVAGYVEEPTDGVTVQPERLVLTGKTAGLTGVTIKDVSGNVVATRTATALGNGLYAVDVSDLARGTYSYTPVGTTSSASGTFEVRGSGTVAGRPAIQESQLHLAVSAQGVEGSYASEYSAGVDPSSNVTLNWQPLADWGNGNVTVTVDYTEHDINGVKGTGTQTQTLSAAAGMSGTAFNWTGQTIESVTRVRVWKNVDGTNVLMYDRPGNFNGRRLEFSNLPANAASVTLEYRPAGSTGAYLVKKTAQIASGWFVAAYDDIVNGSYDYRLTVKDSSGNAIDLTSVGGTSAGQITGTVDIKRGGQSVPALAGGSLASLTPLTTTQHDLYGNTVATTRYFNSAAADPRGFIAPKTDGADQTSYSFFDNYGHAIQAIDAEHSGVYFSYDAQGHVAKRWQILTNADGASQQATAVYEYDRLGQQTGTRDIHTQTVVISFNAGTNPTLTWANPTTLGTTAVLKYRAVGSTAWTTVSTGSGITTSGSTYVVNVSSLTAGQYEYQLSYIRPGEASAYVSTSGIFAVIGTVAAGSTTTVSFVDSRSLSVGASSNATYTPGVTTCDEIGCTTTPGTWSGGNTIGLSWNSLANWGSGNVQVVVTYVASGATFSRSQILSAADGLTGASFSWAAGSSDSQLQSVSRVQVWKMVNNTWIPIYDQGGSGASPGRLILEGNTSGLTGITVTGGNLTSAATLSAAAIGGGVYSVDLSSLANGSYSYTLNGVNSNGGGFSLTGIPSTGAQTTAALVYNDHTQARYNAFGEIAAKGLNDGWQQYYLYDNSDHLWKTNDKDGVNKVHLYNLAGQDTADIVSQGLNFADNTTYATPQSVASLTGSIARSETYYDTLGRATRQVQVSYTTNTALDNIDGSLTFNAGVTPTLTWSQAPTLGTTAVLKYRALGSSIWTTVSTGNGITTSGNSYVVNVAGLAADQYEYQLTYTRPGETSPSASANGVFVVTGANETGSLNAASFVDSRSLSVGTYSDAAYTPAVTTCDESGCTTTPGYWTGGNTISLSWSPLANWGNGNVLVTVTYVASGGTFSRSQILSAVDGPTGASFSWAAGSSDSQLQSVSRVQVWKIVNNTWVPVFDQPGSGASPGRLILEGKTTGLTGITVTGGNLTSATTLSAAAIGGGVYSVDLSSLANGNYSYTLAGASGVGGSFTVTGSATTGRSWQFAANSPVLTTTTPVLTQTLDRWGNVLTVTDPRNGGWVTSYRYNYANQAIQVIKPQTDIWGQNGVDTVGNPTMLTYYDALGHTLAVTDENNNINTSRYDAVGQVIAEYHADGGIAKSAYDTLGRKILALDANGNETDYTYDHNDRLIKEQHPIGATQYVYDQAGNRIKAIDALGNTTVSFYDTLGNVIKTRLPMGQETLMSYDPLHHKLSEVNALGDSQTWTYDYFGKLIGHQDLGGATYQYTYNNTAQLLTQTGGPHGQIPGQSLSDSYYENGQLKTINDNALHGETYYEYDASGHHTRERYRVFDGSTWTTYQDAHIGYDALGRSTKVQDIRYMLTYKYDAVGNRRETLSNYYDNSGNLKVVDNWYVYDAMNRIVLSQGVLAGTGSSAQIQISTTQGIQLFYDADGNRRIARSYISGTLTDDSYNYDADNRLITTNRAGSLTSARTYDDAGRVTQYVAYSSPGVMSERRQMQYNANGVLIQQDNFDSNNAHTSSLQYSPNALGSTSQYTLTAFNANGTVSYSNTYTYNYLKFDSYKESAIQATSTYFSPGSTNETYDVNGNLVSVVDTFQVNNNRSFIVNGQGQMVRKTQNGQIQYYFYANGNPVGSSGDLNSTDFDFNYTPVSDQYPGMTPSSYTVGNGDTLQSIALAVYGDSKLWYLIADANGISSNSGLTPGKVLTVPNKISNLHNDYSTYKPYNPGQIIGDTTPTLPNPPPPPPPQHGGGCGALAMIVIIVVAIVVTVLTAGAALAVLAPAASAGMGVMAAGSAALAGTMGMAGLGAAMIGAAVGSIASQLVGIGLGVQDKFSWGAVASSALMAGVTAGIGGGGVAGQLGVTNTVGQQVVNGMANNVINQGINIITGQQQKFSWQSVAVAAITAPISGAIGGGQSKGGADVTVSSFAKSVGQEMLKSAVNQAVTIAIDGHGKMNWAKVASDGFGNAIGNSIVDQTVYDERQARLAQAPRSLAQAPQPAAGNTGSVNDQSAAAANRMYADASTSMTDADPDPVNVAPYKPDPNADAMLNAMVDLMNNPSSPKPGTMVLNDLQTNVTEASIDIDKSVKYLNEHAADASRGFCATYVREAIDAGGATLDHTLYAKNYGPILEDADFTKLDMKGYTPQKGDVAIFQPVPDANPAGHMQMYNGEKWVSDFKQRDEFPGPNYRKQNAPYQVYRP